MIKSLSAMVLDGILPVTMEEPCFDDNDQELSYPTPMADEDKQASVSRAKILFESQMYEAKPESSFAQLINFSSEMAYYYMLQSRFEKQQFKDNKNKSRMKTAIQRLLPRKAPRLIGGAGTGKTTLLRFVNKVLRMNYYDVHDLRCGLMESGVDFFSSFKSDTGHKHIVIDDVGAERDAHYFGSTFGMEDILTERYKRFQQDGYLTVISSNLTRAEMSKRYGVRVSSRLEEMTFPVAWDSQNYRK